MAGQNDNSGKIGLVVIVLIILAFVLYQCYGGQLGLPTLSSPPAGSSASASEASGAASSEAASAEISAASATEASTSAESSDSGESASSFTPPSGLSYAACTPQDGGHGFFYCAPGDLIPNSRGPGVGDQAYPVPASWALDNLSYGGGSVLHKALCFPLADGAFPNSQFFNPGGHGYFTPQALALPPSQLAALKAQDNAGTISVANYNLLHDLESNPANYALPWRDTFCENRGYSQSNIVCTGGAGGHQGQDIRPETLKKDWYWAVAVEDGTIYETASDTANATRYWLKLRAGDAPTRYYNYLHMLPASKAQSLYASNHTKYAYLQNYPAWHAGDHVVAGQKLGLVSTYFGSSSTTTHLHFEIRMVLATTVNGKAIGATGMIPPYKTLVNAYQRRLNGGACPVS